MVAGLATAFVTKVLKSPWLAVNGLLCVVSFILALRKQQTNFVLYNLAFVFLALAAAELYFGYNAANDKDAYHHLTRDSVFGLGYSASPGVFRAKKTRGFGTRLIYDVTYTIDANGLRQTPAPGCGPAVFFFGSSTTFGEGVNDSETLPFYFAEATHLRAVNFGLNGYGPHQMLRMLEVDRPGVAGAGVPQLVVYLADSDHILRAAGLAVWDQDGPLYGDRDGRATYSGSFRANGLFHTPSIAERVFKNSRIYQALALPGFDSSAWEPQTVARNRSRFASILTEGKRIVEERYHVPMVVILGIDAGRGQVHFREDSSWMEARLREEGILVLRVPEFFSSAERDQWTIPYDSHPNARQYQYLATTLVTLLRENGVKLAHDAPCQ